MPSSSGLVSLVHHGLADAPKVDLAVVCASFTPRDVATAPVLAWLRRLASHGTYLAGIDTGSDILVKPEDLRDARMVARGAKAHDKASGEEVLTVSVRLLFAVDEDIRKRRCRVCEVGRLLEGVEESADPSVDLGRIVVVDRTAILVRGLGLGVH